MNKTLISLLAVVAVAHPVHASFELVMVADYANKVIHRIDGTTGQYFGSFGGGILTSPIGMDINVATNTCYVVDRNTGKVLKFNYNTGVYIGSFNATFGSSPGLRVTSAGNILIDNYFGSATMYPASGALTTSFVPQGGAGGIFGLDEGPDGAIYAVMQGTGRIQRYQNNGTPSTFATGATANSIGQTVAIFNGVGYYSATASYNSIGRFKTGATPTVLSPWNLSGVYSNVRGVAAGHGDLLYVAGANTSGGFTLARLDADSGVVRSTVNFAQISADCPSITSVVAPEPASLLALGLGALVLARRRRLL